MVVVRVAEGRGVDVIWQWRPRSDGLAQWRSVVVVAVLRTRFLPESGGVAVQQVPEDGAVHVAGQVVHEQPVGVRCLPGDDGQVDGVETGARRRLAQQQPVERLARVEGVLDAAPHESGHADGQQDEHEPEPQDRVDLLVDDVERHHAHGVVRLHGAGRTELVEVALGHLGEHLVEQPVAVVVVERVQTVPVELAAQEFVHELHLEHDVDQVEHLAPDEHRCPVAVQPEPGDRVQVVHDLSQFGPPGRLGRDAPGAGHGHVLVAVHLQVQPLQPVDEQPDGARLVRTPHEMWKVEQQGLAEQHERHPLVVRVADGARVPVHGAYARVRRVVGVGHGVRGGEEAVRVDDVVGHAGGDAPDVLSDVLTAAHQRGASQQYGERQPVVDAESRVIDGHQPDPGEPGLADDRAEHADHGEIGLRTGTVRLPSAENANKRETFDTKRTGTRKTKTTMH